MEFVLFVLGLAVAIIIAAYASSIEDCRVRLSIRTTQRKIVKLEKDLKLYEEDFADTRLFVGRMLHNGLAAIVTILCLLIS